MMFSEGSLDFRQTTRLHEQDASPRFIDFQVAEA